MAPSIMWADAGAVGRFLRIGRIGRMGTSDMWYSGGPIRLRASQEDSNRSDLACEGWEFDGRAGLSGGILLILEIPEMLFADPQQDLHA